MNQPPRIKPPRESVPKTENLCAFCTVKCCRYFALPIDTPTEPKDFDYLRWYLLHEQASVFLDEGIWYLLVHTTCRHLQDDYRCGIYHTRPQICREYSTDNCEYDDSYVYEGYFELPDQVQEYFEARFTSDPEDPHFRSPKPEMFPILNN
jgi:Fe-S-cluster containining protein